MNALCCKPAQINNECETSADTIYITTFTNTQFFKNTFKSKLNFNDVFEKVLSAETQEILNCKTKRDDIVANHRTLPNLDLQYVIIKFNPNSDSFIIIDKNRNVVNDSSIRKINVEALSIKGDLSSDERNLVINYLKLRTNDPTGKATISENNYIIHFKKYLKDRVFENHIDILITEQIIAKWLN